MKELRPLERRRRKLPHVHGTSATAIHERDADDDETQAATKAAVFTAAERLFALHGFQNVSVRDITAEAGVNLACVNYHFGSKDALLFEIFRRRTARAEPRAGAHAARGQRPP